MLANMKTGTKIFLGFALALLTSVVVGWSGLRAVSQSNESINDLGGTNLPGLYGLGEITEGQARVGYALRGLVLYRIANLDGEYRAVEQGLRQIDNGRESYEPLEKTPEEQRVWREVQPLMETWKRTVEDLVARSRDRQRLASSGASAEALKQAEDAQWEATVRSREARAQSEAKLHELQELNVAEGKSAVKTAEEQGERDRSMVIAVLVISFVLLALLALYLTRNIGNAIRLIIKEAEQLASAATEGRLATRGDTSQLAPEFRPIVKGFNDTLDSVTRPLNVAADYIDRIAKGNIPPKITDKYNGDFNELKNNLNQCVEAVNQLVADANGLAQAAIAGELKTRADASRHQGDFRKIVVGFNETLDATINPVMEATRVLEALANYDLRVRMEGEYRGDHARIKVALNNTATALHDALVSVADAVEQVSGATRQIAASSQSVAQGSSEQASALEETSSSLEEMSGMTKQNADNTIQAKTLAQTTKEAAEKGGHAMERMTDAMEKIQAASEGTSQIIKDINDIAFQTNLLALNAAVEAARAGEAGRGFAVVAEEVRNLALRSKEAAKKTEDLIRMSVGHAENGRVIAGEVATNLTEIVGAAGKVTDIVGEIAVASQEQARGIDQVNKAVAEMDKVVQTAAANAEESSSAAEELSSQAEELGVLVGRFTLAHSSRAPQRGEARAPRTKSLSIAPQARRGQAQSRSKPGNGRDKSTIRLSPEELIPLQDDPDFKDF